MPSSYTAQHDKLEFAWVGVPPAVDKEQFLGQESWHERRRAAHTSSFLALGLLANKVGKPELKERYLRCTSAFEMKTQLAEKDYHCLAQTRQLCSRSHTDEWACACLSDERPDKASVGVDIESRQRDVKPGLERFYAHPEDQTSTLQPIEIWCLKEAIFKAVSSFLKFNSHKGPKLVLTDFKLSALGPSDVLFHYKEFQGRAGILPQKLGPPDVCTAWALLRI